MQLAHSISTGLDYPGIGPEHSYYHDIGRVTFENASDTQAMNALINFTKHEGVIPAIESAHALSYVEKTSAYDVERRYYCSNYFWTWR